MAKYLLIEKYLQPIIDKRRQLNQPKKSQLLSVIDQNQGERLEKLLINLEKNVGNFGDIFKITKELNNKINPDERIDDMIAELRGAFLLLDKKFTELKYQKKSFDFRCKKNNQGYAVEIKFIRGPNFKNQKRIAPGLGYKLDAAPELNKLKAKIEKGFSQIPSNLKGIVIIVTNNIEMDKSWFGEKIEQFRKSTEQDLRLKIFIVTNGDIYG